MLRTTSGLSRSVVKWVSQVAASVGATLVASMIFAALPKPELSATPAPRPELTSGGKYAARAVAPMAYDGLDTMPLPHVAPIPVTVVPILAGEAPMSTARLHEALWDGAAPLALAPERSLRSAKPVHAVAKAEARHVVGGAEPVAPAGVATVASDARADDAFMPALVPHLVPRMLSTAQAAWNLTAAAGGSLMAHIVPQLP